MSETTYSFSPSKCGFTSLKCHMVANACGVKLVTASFAAPCYPALCITVTNKKANTSTNNVVFSANAICRYFIEATAGGQGLWISTNSNNSNVLNDLFALEEFTLVPALQTKNRSTVSAVLSVLEDATGKYHKLISVQPLLQLWLSPILDKCLTFIDTKFPFLSKIVADSKAGDAYKSTAKLLIPPSYPNNEWLRKGVQATLKELYTWAIVHAYPTLMTVPIETSSANTTLTVDVLRVAIITKCNNVKFGDYQCNNAMALSKLFKLDTENKYQTAGTSISPKDIALKILEHVPANNLIESASAAPNGFINIKFRSDAIELSIAAYNQHTITTSNVNGGSVISVAPPLVERPLDILVDFSSPNIAKEMHVGHLRSTIIGDSICRVLEYCQHNVMRVNHVGDWGTQFGMLITYLQDAYPDILTNPPNISDLTAIYKASKKRFDAEPEFKERSRLNVVNLQSGDANCRAVWKLLCDISRKEFQIIYDALQVNIEEYGESYYNSMIPTTLDDMEKAGFVTYEEGMMLMRLAHFEIPLILRKSDGGYGYDSTDMAAIKHRCLALKRDWIIYVTDAGQANHFYMVFDAARKMKWAPVAPFSNGSTFAPAGISNGFGSNNAVFPDNKTNVRLDHIGFGVVCGDDGKKFKTRSSETVKLIDLLTEAANIMETSLRERKAEGKTAIPEEGIAKAASIMGYGAVKYFDLKQNPISSYVFSYERMLDTKGDTAIYLLFAYARVTSILRKAKEDKNIDISDAATVASVTPAYDHAAERALAMELMCFSDVIQFVVQDLMPNRLCDYLKDLAVKFSDFVTKCQVLSSKEVVARLLLCEATKRIMDQCFSILGISTLDRI